MERMLKMILSITLLMSTFGAHAAITRSVTPKFTVRSFGTNAVRRMVHSVGHVNMYDMDKIYGTLSVTGEYTRSFDSDEIAKCLFGDAICDCTIKIQGSRVSGRDENALLADYFYLPTDFSSSVRIEPRIQSFSADFFGYLGLDEWVEGLYLWVQFPVTWSKWDLDFCETSIAPGANDHDAGYFTSDTLPRENLLANFSEYAIGKSPDAVIQDDITVNFNGLECAKICTGDDTKTTVPEVRFAFGWNFLLDEDYHLGLNIQASAPSGNDVNSDFLFSPQNGNDDHWELGGGLSTHFILWRSEDEEKHFGFYLDANITHMFKNSQCRCFDLCGKPLSRYMLAENMNRTNPDDELQQDDKGNTGKPATTFNDAFTPVANITKLNVDVSVGVNADVVAMFNYTHGGWNWDLGYNLWARSCEKIRRKSDCKDFAENTWALKGDAHVFGFEVDSTTFQNARRLSATQSEATVNGGRNFGTSGNAVVATARTNPNIDNKQLAEFATNDLFATRNSSIGSNQINTSIQPKFINLSDINFSRTKGLSHKVFSHLGYTWVDKEDWIPYVGVGFEVEFASDSSDCNDDCDTDCDTSCDGKTNGNCIKCGLSQWGVWLKGGVSFN